MEKKKADITVIGCGWLGLPLLHAFVRAGHIVQGTARTRDSLYRIKDEGGIPLFLRLKGDSPEGETERIASCKHAVICIPPGREDPDAYPAQMASLGRLLAAGTAEHVLMISSISVYPEGFSGAVAPVTPAPDTARGRRMLAAEQALREALGDRLCVLRLGGLAGPGRHPGRFLAGRKGLTGGHEPVNMIHREDALGIILGLINGRSGSCYHAAAPHHPEKAAFYRKMAEEGGFEPPEFSETSGGEGRLIDPEGAALAAAHVWRFPDPMCFPFH